MCEHMPRLTLTDAEFIAVPWNLKRDIAYVHVLYVAA